MEMGKVLGIIKQNGAITEEELERIMKEKKKEEAKKLADEQFKLIIEKALDEEERQVFKTLLEKILKAQNSIFLNEKEIRKQLEKVEFALSLDIPDELRKQLTEKAKELKETLKSIEENPRKFKKSPILNWRFNIIEQILKALQE